MSSTENSGSSNGDETYVDDARSPTGITHQLQVLQSLVPNLTQTDPESILEQTQDYLRRIQEETQKIEQELSQEDHKGSSSSGPFILGVETEELREGSFVVKVRWRNEGEGVAGRVQRVIENLLYVQMTSVVLNERSPQEMISTAFVQVERGTRMSEEELQELIMNEARKSGLFALTA